MFPIVFALAMIPLTAATCPSTGGTLSFQGPCTFDNIKNQTGCDLLNDLSVSAKAVKEACDANAFAFSSITNETRNFDDTYFNGGGPFNNDKESDGVDKEQSLSASKLFRIRENLASSKRILMPEYDNLLNYTYISYFGPEAADSDFQAENQEELNDYPPYLSQFNLTSGCELNSIMCCFTEDRMRTGFEDNADVCAHDLRHSTESNNVRTGFGVYDRSAPAYCTAFKWDEDENSASYQYRGNALFDISFGTFLERGYVKNIPGAPMCACVENMPVVTNAACRTVNVTEESYTLTYDGSGIEIVQDDVNISYEDCGEDFKAFHYETDMEEAASKIDQHIVDSCVDTQLEFLNDHFLIPVVTDQFDTPPKTKWQHVAGQGIGYYPTKTNNVTVRDEEFRSYFAQSPNNITFRHCPTCRESHQRIYYRRLTPLPPPEEFNFIDLFLNNWFSKDNMLHVDFELYSTYDDALNMVNGWTACNYDDSNVGFPRDCGPTGLVPCQWNSYQRGPCRPTYYDTSNHAFYIEIDSAVVGVQ